MPDLGRAGRPIDLRVDLHGPGRRWWRPNCPPCRTNGSSPPEQSEWAAFFAATQAQRDAVAAGFTAGATTRQADDLMRDAAAF